MTNTYTIVEINDDDAVTIASCEAARRHFADVVTLWDHALRDKHAGACTGEL